MQKWIQNNQTQMIKKCPHECKMANRRLYMMTILYELLFMLDWSHFLKFIQLCDDGCMIIIAQIRWQFKCNLHIKGLYFGCIYSTSPSPSFICIYFFHEFYVRKFHKKIYGVKFLENFSKLIHEKLHSLISAKFSMHFENFCRKKL